MDQIEFKRKFIAHCIQTLNKNAMIAKEAMDEAQQSANEYGLPKDRYDSFRAQILRKRDLFAEQYQKMLDEMELYNKPDIASLKDNVRFGSMVITSVHKLFVATSLGKINFENDDYFVISPKTPLFEQLKGKKRGDSVLFNQKKINILEVF